MSCAKNARKLADYISGLPHFNQTFNCNSQFAYYHIGALFTDVVLQAGLNYHSVVKPRVQQVMLNYPDDITVSKFGQVIAREGLSTIINWSHSVKLDRFNRLMDFALCNNIDSCFDLKSFLLKKNSCELFLSLNGFGPKSLDYLSKLLSIDTVAVDRHIYMFVKMADIDTKGYQDTKKVVEFAADLLGKPRCQIDKVIWEYMSQKKIPTVRENTSSVL